MAGLAPNEKSMHFWPSAKRLLGTLRPQRVTMIVVLVLSVISVALSVTGPWIIGKAVDYIYSGAIASRLPAGQSKEQVVEGLRHSGQNTLADMIAHLNLIPGTGIDFGKVGEILAIALAVYVCSSVLQYIQSWLLTGAVQRAMADLRRDVEHKINRLPLRYFDNQPRGELLSRVTNDIDNLGQSLTQSMSQLLVSLMSMVGVLVMMLVVSPLLTLVAVVSIPVAMLITAQLMKRSQKQFVAQWKHTGSLNAQIEEAFSGHELVTVFGRRPQVEARFRDKNGELMDAGYRAQFISGLVMPIMMFVGNLQYVIVCVLGGLRVASGALSLGDVTAFIQYSRQFTQPMTQVASMTNLLQSGVASAERVFEVLDAEDQEPDRDAQLPTPVQGKVSFDDVSFGYKPDVPLIEHLNLTAEPGQTIAIVGPTGAGKTTLVNLIMRFYELNSGRILLDDKDITEISRADLRSKIGMVLQDTWLFEGTIEENIRYGNLEATDEQVLAAATATFVDRFVHSLPDGYQTVIDDEGTNLSAGERQLITIARAFLSDPAILILDEATSSVDTRTEVLLQHAMNALRSDRTSFVIAHRLSTIRDADTIIVMENGHIVEHGNHVDLLAARGAYHRLYMSQFEGALVDETEELAPVHS
ncbi:ABC transporter ATP-binding protein/permease [Corynebacteriales bacterium D3-21]|uniref:Fatty acid ABC transporter ATP-binding/permease protein n=2 Tax=Speluncibacter jeojiensis TaxID=2710754 RepID=A0A9X4LXT3_9ACTN|nr:ABC transporter ATP-binding protein [Rhodococcus sp. D2-41]MDG3014353.1 ABC transporter ATP-binding protein/permease [Corynebacteriales bacterium D3-21]